MLDNGIINDLMIVQGQNEVPMLVPIARQGFFQVIEAWKKNDQKPIDGQPTCKPIG